VGWYKNELKYDWHLFDLVKSISNGCKNGTTSNYDRFGLHKSNKSYQNFNWNWTKLNQSYYHIGPKKIKLIKIILKGVLFQIFLIIWSHSFGGLHNFQFGIVQKMPYGMWSCFTCTSFDESLSLKFNNYSYKHGFNNHKKSWNVF